MTAETTSFFTQYMPQIAFSVNLVIAGLVGFVGAWVKLSRCEHTINSHTASLSSISEKITALGERLAKVEGGLERDRANWVQKQSPLSLTPQGEVVLKESFGKTYIDQNKEKLIKEIKLQHPKSAYDVQELSRKVIDQKSNDDDFIPIKNFAFRSGENLSKVVDVLGIYLRDIALIELGFDIRDIKD